MSSSFACSECGKSLSDNAPYLELKSKTWSVGVVHSADLFCSSGCLMLWLHKNSRVLTGAYLKALAQMEESLQVIKNFAAV